MACLFKKLVVTRFFDYSYDANGSIRMLKHRATESATPTYYYYALNSRNDVVGLYNSSGAVYAKYTYDPWGNITSVTNASGTTISDENNIAHTQPFRYRSYYYDTDSGFYYLQSRYYDPVTHRFINADGLVSTGTGVLGHNMFVYCNNNPTNGADPSGNYPLTLRELQNNLNSGTNCNYTLMDITKLQMAGYGYNDKFTVNSNGTISPYNVANQIFDTVWSWNESLGVSVGAGYGIGAGIVIDDVPLECKLKADLVMISYSPSDGFDIGHILDASFSVLLDELSWDDIQYESFIDSSKNYSTLDGNVPNKEEFFSVGGYCIIGYNLSFSFNKDYYDMRQKEIWN